MGNHHYDSPTYIAGKLTETMRDASAMSSIGLGSISSARQGGQSGEKVSFKIQGIENIISVSKQEDSYKFQHYLAYDSLETIKKEINRKVVRSKTGRISGDYFPNFIKRFIIPNIQKYSRKYISKTKQ